MQIHLLRSLTNLHYSIYLRNLHLHLHIRKWSWILYRKWLLRYILGCPSSCLLWMRFLYWSLYLGCLWLCLRKRGRRRSWKLPLLLWGIPLRMLQWLLILLGRGRMVLELVLELLELWCRRMQIRLLRCLIRLHCSIHMPNCLLHLRILNWYCFLVREQLLCRLMGRTSSSLLWMRSMNLISL